MKSNLQKQRDAKVAGMKMLLATAEAEGRVMSGPESDRFDQLEREIGKIDAGIGKDDSTEQFLGRMHASAQPPMVDVNAGPAAVIEGWRDSATGKIIPVLSKGQSFKAAVRKDSTERSKFSFGAYIRAMALGTDNREIRMALGENSIGTGGATVPTDLLADVIDRLRNEAAVMRAGTLTVPLPTEVTNVARLDTDPITTWKAENAQFGTGDPTFDRVTFTAKTLGCLVLVSRELLQDSSNIDEVLLNSFAKSMALSLDLAALIGDGTTVDPGGPVGITNTAGVGSYSMGTNGAAPTNYAPVVDAIQIMLSANAKMPTAAVMAPRTICEFANAVDTLGQPMRRPDLIADLPFIPTNQIPINDTQGTSNAASKIIVGDFSQLMVGIRSELRIEILKERYADYLQMGFLCWLRADVQCKHPQSFSKVIGVL
jgi:HK97 family phage major capsid protein